MHQWRQRQRRLIFCSLILICTIWFTGCVGGEDYKTYIDAANKTDGIEKGASEIQISVINTFNEDILADMSEADRKMISTLNQVELNITSHFNHVLGQSIHSIYYLYKGLGADIKIYRRAQEEMYLKLPFDGNFYRLNDEANNDSVQVDGEQVDIQSVFIQMGSDWNNILKSENIFVGEKSIISNDVGEIKVTKFTIKPTSVQLAEFVKRVKSNILSNEAMLIKYINANQSEDIIDQASFESFVDALFESMSITRFDEVAFVDIDGYVVDEQLEIEIAYSSSSHFSNILENQKITIHSKHWDIEKKQDFDFSELDLSKVVPIEQLMKGSVKP
ncbi:hypothetical protein [Fusibacter bizertensis]